MNLKYFLLISVILSFFQRLMGQNITQNLPTDSLSRISAPAFQPYQTKAEAIIEQLLAKKIVPSISVSVAQADAVLWQQAYGFADVQRSQAPDPERTLYRIASVSKPISAVGLAKMHQDGILDWNASLYDYVPQFPAKKYDFTLKQLGGHLAGIRTYRGKEVFNNAPLSIQQGVDLFSASPLLFRPGSRYFYTTYDWCLLSLAMQNAAGEGFPAYMHREIFCPLQMHHTFPDSGGALLDAQAVPYSKNAHGFHPATAVDNFFKTAGGGFLSTAADIRRLGQAILRGDFLSATVQEEMLTSQRLLSGKRTGYGIGWQTSFDKHGNFRWGHIGNGIGGYAWFFIYPENGVVVCLLSNITNPTAAGAYFQQIINVVLEGAKQISASEDPEKGIPDLQQPHPHEDFEEDEPNIFNPKPDPNTDTP